MKPLPTDLEILNEIYERYYLAFSKATGRTKIYVAIEIEPIASALAVDPDIVFGRLYYHLDRKFRYRQEDRTLVPLFTRELEEGKHHVHFPYMASVLAELRLEDQRHRASNFLALAALIFSGIAILVSIFAR